MGDAGGKSTETKNEQPLPTDVEDHLMNGRFSEYHLAKARLALGQNDLKTAKYQVAASLCHGRLPDALALKAELRKRKN